MCNDEVRVRFAPSPTGPFHIGGARSALFNYLLARKTGGKLILRIEDTDRERSTPESEENIKAALKWLGMDWDEGVDVGGPNGPYHQMERLDIYKKYTDKLLAEGKAYYCYCTDEELEEERQSLIKEGKMPRYMGKCRHLTEEQIAQFKAEGRKPTVRFRVPADQQILVRDMVRGDVVFDSNNIGDFVIVKSDGIPTYNYAVVIDDALMHITHVIRAEEHLSNTPRQCLVYDALGFKKPTFGHISLILGKDHTKMSKRHGDPSYEDLIAQGYLTDAVVNYVALLGWSPGGEREIYTMREMAEIFDIRGISKSPAIFDIEKLKYFNAEYIRAMSPDAFAKAAEPFIRRAVKNQRIDPAALAALLQQRTEVLTDIPEKLDFFDELPGYDTALYIHKKSKTDEAGSLEMLRKMLPVFEALPDWNDESILAAMTGMAESCGCKNAKVMWPVRIAAAGKAVTPGGAVEICRILGKDETLRRIRVGIEKLEGAVG